MPPSPDTSEALVAAFAERDIEFIPGRRVAALDGARNVAVLDDGRELPFDLFLGVPKHRAPDVVVASGMTENGWVPVSPQTLETRFPGVYAVGDVATIGVPKAGVFAEGAARAVAASLIASIRGGEQPGPYGGPAPATSSSAPAGSAVSTSTSSRGRSPRAPSAQPSAALVAEKHEFGSSRARALVRALTASAGRIAWIKHWQDDRRDASRSDGLALEHEEIDRARRRADEAVSGCLEQGAVLVTRPLAAAGRSAGASASSLR